MISYDAVEIPMNTMARTTSIYCEIFQLRTVDVQRTWRRPFLRPADQQNWFGIFL